MFEWLAFTGLSRQKYYQLLTLPAVAVVAVVLLTALVLGPQINGVIRDVKETRELKQKSDALVEKAALLSNLNEGELEIRSRKLTAVLPADEDLGYFFTAIKSMAERAKVKFSGIELVGVAPGGPAVAKGVAKVARRSAGGARPAEDESRIVALIEGDIAGLNRFLVEMEESIPLVKAGEFSFTSDVGTGTLRAKVTLRYFYVAPPETIGKSEQSLPTVTAAEEQTYEQILEFREPETVELPRVETGNTQLMM